jgi:hypothetical protein
MENQMWELRVTTSDHSIQENLISEDWQALHKRANDITNAQLFQFAGDNNPVQLIRDDFSSRNNCIEEKALFAIDGLPWLDVELVKVVE